MQTSHKNTFIAQPQGNEGFTLIETLVAVFILTVGIFALYSMQTTSIRYNSSANAITGSSTWATDRIEQLLALAYNNPLLNDGDNNGDAGLNTVGPTADGSAVSPDQRYTIFWNVANRMIPNPADPTDSTVKIIRVTVQHNDFGINKQVVLNYYKQKVF